MLPKQKYRVFAVLLIVALLSPTLIVTSTSTTGTASASSSSDDWPMFHYDTAFTGHSNSQALESCPKALWTTGYEHRGGFMPSSPAIVNNIVYVNDFGLYAYDATTGRLIWEQEDNHLAAPVVENGVVYTPSGAFDAQTGSVLWKAGGTRFAAVGRFVAVADGIFYTGLTEHVSGADDRGLLVALDASNGERLWSKNYFSYFAPAIANGQLFFGPFTLNATTGDDIWRWNTSVQINYSPAYSNDNVFFDDINGHLFCVNALNGTAIWQNTFAAHSAYSSPAVADGLVFLGTYDGKVLAFNATDGNKVWAFSTTKASSGETISVDSSPAVAGGIVYVTASDGNLYALNAYNGVELWQYNVGAQPQYGCSPAIANGHIYVGSKNTRLTALEANPFNLLVVVASLIVFVIAICGVILFKYKRRRKKK